MTSTEYIPGPNGKRIEVTTSSGESFLSLLNTHFILDPDDAPLHGQPRELSPPGSLGQPNASNADQQGLADELCKRCSAIDLGSPPSLCNERDWGNMLESRMKAVAENRSKGGTQIEGYVCDLGQFPDDFSVTSCRLCRALGSIRTRLLESPLGIQPWPYELHVVSAAYVHFAEQKGGVVNIFAVDPKPPHIFFYGRVGFWLTEHSGTSGYLYPVAPEGDNIERGIFGRQLRTDRIEYAVLRSWLHSCKIYHQEGCNSGKPDFLHEIENFRLIDCNTRQVIPATIDMSYVALSYTWGLGALSIDTTSCSEVPTEPSMRVIEDSMVVTRELGLRYLWVDKYCIIQNDLQMKMAQIQNMDAVYGQAEVTIIAAASESELFGLPGVSKRCRIPQPAVQVDGIQFASSGPHLRDLLLVSKWATRGWTYQEGLLSRRRLIFTDYQIYFECASSHCCEAISAPPDVLFRESHIDDAYSMASREFRVFPLDKPVAKSHQILDRIQEYASKQLSYHSDALNGILGVLELMKKREPSITHLWGIPILTQTETSPPRIFLPDSPRSKPKQIIRDVDQALVFGLRWKIQPRKRNSGFPSWSWTGWTGPLHLSFPPADVEWARPEIPPSINFWVENSDGHLINWREFYASRDHRGKHLAVSRYLHIEGPSIKLEFQFGKLSGSNRAFPHQQDTYGLHVLVQINELQISICPLVVTGWRDDSQAFVNRLLFDTWDSVIFSHKGPPLPPETHVLGREVEISYETLAKEKRTEFKLLVLEPVGDAYERLGTVKLVFPENLALPSPGSLKIERKKFRIG